MKNAKLLREVGWFTEFLRDQAEVWELEAFAVDAIRDQAIRDCDPLGASIAMGSAETFRAMARSFREAVPTDDHEWDQTLADIVDLPEAQA